MPTNLANSQNSPLVPEATTSRKLFYLKLLSMVLVIVGIRWWILSLYGTAVPGLDEWDGEAWRIYIPWLQDNLTWRHFFVPHNEHQMVPSSILSFLLFRINGEWDPLTGTAASNFVYALAAVAVVLAVVQAFGRKFENCIIIATTALWSIPFDTHNMLKSIHSMWFFLFLFSFLAVWGLLMYHPRQASWGLGVMAIVASCFSFASGCLAGVVVAIIATWQIIFDEKQRRRWGLVILVGLLALTLGLFLYQPVERHEVLKAHTVGAFVSKVGFSAAFPFTSSPWFSLYMYCPFVLLLITLIRKRRVLNNREMITLALGFWGLLQIAAISFGRGGSAGPPANRYLDTIAMGVMANFLALPLLTDFWRNRPSRLPWLRGSALLWVLIPVMMMSRYAYRQTLPTEQARRQTIEVHLINCKRYTVSKGKIPLPQTFNSPKLLPYFDPIRLALILDCMRGYLPPELSPGAQLAGGDATRTGFRLLPEFESFGEKEMFVSTKENLRPTVGKFRSRLIWIDPRKKPYLQIPVAGALGAKEVEGLSLSLETEDGRPPIPVFAPPNLSKRIIYTQLANPGVPFRLVASDKNPAVWFAFGEPRGMGPLSYWTRWLIPRGLIWLAFGVCLFIIANGAKITRAWLVSFTEDEASEISSSPEP